ncbi:MAG: 4Fe-4S binding protein [Syntrophomonadaceae bacterium]|jgi:2-oxoglutarate ferredoxin oxidoreductase subunit delta|nr:4Fe-4S binding protein [Syntrophomonadaceae bacterium]
MPKGRVTLDEGRCKACELCIFYCPRGVLGIDKSRINAQGYHPATAVAPEKCNGCAICGRMCPDLVIEVERE